MTGEIIIVPRYSNVNGPLVFLAGPIQGALEWQDKAIEILRKNAPDLHIASPRRKEEYEGEFTKEMYYEQVDWETHYLNRAAEDGCIMFWLAEEYTHICSRAYAQTSRFELAKWTTKKLYEERIKIAVGIDEGFSGARYIRYELSKRADEIPILGSLENTCLKTIEMIYNN
ncbi:nucleoside 2-deoxyribosyltransferase domain-containing protein [Candidatus Woesearchaeota archaeon]|nr:nucleoside 2-deoxyribosyltransferase domain-containing protein [Candidatus Woesearchaeota archaeon]